MSAINKKNAIIFFEMNNEIKKKKSTLPQVSTEKCSYMKKKKKIQEHVTFTCVLSNFEAK